MSRTDKEWENWGYPSKEPCYICGNTNDTKLEPRFYYAICREHSVIPPIYLDDYLKESYSAESAAKAINRALKSKEEE